MTGTGRLVVGWVALAAAGCDVPACPKDRVLGPGDLPCTCAGAVVDEVDCGAFTCTDFGVYASTTDATCDSGTTASASAR